ncbi:uncharacterized protein FYW61_000459 [Anableps anableps]
MNSTAAAAEGTKAAPPELEQKESRQFKSKAPQRGQKGVDNHDPAMEGLDDAAVVCPWEEYGDVELSELAQFGTVSKRGSVENMNASAVSETSKPSPAEFKQKDSRQFKSKAPKPGQKGFNNTLPGMEGLDDAAVICPWEEFGDVELSDLAQFGTA